MTHVERAKKFLNDFMPFFEAYPLYKAIEYYNRAHATHPVQMYYGTVRVCLVMDDFAIKWDISKAEARVFGGCYQEFRAYCKARKTGYGYLFASCTRTSINHHCYYIYPRINELAMDRNEYEIDEYLSEEEQTFIYDELEIRDLHDENWGFDEDGNMRLIDYACNIFRQSKE